MGNEEALMMGRSFLQGICCILTCLALTIPAAHAQVEDGMLLFEIYGGNTDPQGIQITLE